MQSLVFFSNTLFFSILCFFSHFCCSVAIVHPFVRTFVRLFTIYHLPPNIFYRGTEAILFNDRRHTFNENIRHRTEFVEKAIGHHDMCPSSYFFLYLHCSSSAPLLSWLLTTLPPLLFSLYSSSSSLLFACRSLGSVAFRFPLHRHTTVADVGKWNLSAVFMCVSNCVSVIRRKEILWKNIRTNSGHIQWTMSSFLLVLWELFVHLVNYYLLHFLRHMNISPAHCLSRSLLHLLCRSFDVYRLDERGKGAHFGFRASLQQFYTVQMMASTTIKLMTLRSMTKSCC